MFEYAWSYALLMLLPFYIAIGLNLYLDSQSICIVGFGFPTKGGPMLGSPGPLLFPQTLLFTSQNHYLSFLEWLLSSPPSLSRIANPHSSFFSPIYRLG